MTQPNPLRTLKDSAVLLGELLDKAAEQRRVTGELWSEIAEAAVQVPAAAEMLAGDAEDDSTE